MGFRYDMFTANRDVCSDATRGRLYSYTHPVSTNGVDECSV